MVIYIRHRAKLICSKSTHTFSNFFVVKKPIVYFDNASAPSMDAPGAGGPEQAIDCCIQSQRVEASSAFYWQGMENAFEP